MLLLLPAQSCVLELGNWGNVCFCQSEVSTLKVYARKQKSAIFPSMCLGYKWVGRQPETLADRLLGKHSHPASKIEANSDKNFEICMSLDLEKH
eukprot:381500-Pelagomonas_calceolata.AAC.1